MDKVKISRKILQRNMNYYFQYDNNLTDRKKMQNISVLLTHFYLNKNKSLSDLIFIYIFFNSL